MYSSPLTPVSDNYQVRKGTLSPLFQQNSATNFKLAEVRRGQGPLPYLIIVLGLECIRDVDECWLRGFRQMLIILFVV